MPHIPGTIYEGGHPIHGDSGHHSEIFDPEIEKNWLEGMRQLKQTQANAKAGVIKLSANDDFGFKKSES